MLFAIFTPELFHVSHFCFDACWILCSTPVQKYFHKSDVWEELLPNAFDFLSHLQCMEDTRLFGSLPTDGIIEHIKGQNLSFWLVKTKHSFANVQIF